MRLVEIYVLFISIKEGMGVKQPVIIQKIILHHDGIFVDRCWQMFKYTACTQGVWICISWLEELSSSEASSLCLVAGVNFSDSGCRSSELWRARFQEQHEL